VKQAPELWCGQMRWDSYVGLPGVKLGAYGEVPAYSSDGACWRLVKECVVAFHMNKCVPMIT